MTHDPIDEWLKNSVTNPEIMDAYDDMSNSLNKIGGIFLEDTEINELDATWMTAVAVGYLYQFLRNEPSHVAQLKSIYTEFRRMRDTIKLEQLLQKTPSNLNQ
jgi:hypothetical protein